ncbi:MAG: hypothetical protein DHS20C15_28950 [Planctomycetota bacterium]|nr:MAG: hypothetical protein DHS20C15_28950 [Planctomycetota bacterium]
MAHAARHPRRCATGIYATHDELFVTSVAPGLRSPKVIAQQRVSLGRAEGEGLAARLAELQAAGELPGQLTCSVDPRHLFSLTRSTPKAVSTRERLSVARRLLPPRLGALRGGVAVDAAALKLRGGHRALVVACPRGFVEDFLEGLGRRPTSQRRLAPVPLALGEFALRGVRLRRQQLHAVYLPGAPHGVALLRAGNATVAWRLIDTSEDGSRQSVVTAITSLLDHAREDLGLSAPSSLVACVGDEQRELAESLAADLQLTLQLAPRCFADAESFALALAAAGLTPEAPKLDLFAELAPRTDLRANFPRAVTAGLGSVVLGCAAWLMLQTHWVQGEAQALRREAEAISSELDALLPEIPNRLEDLELAMGSAQAFLVDRVFWERSLRVLPYLVPDEMRLVLIEARDPMIDPLDGADFSSAKRQLVLTGEAALGLAEHAPAAALALTNALRDDQVLSESLGRVTGANIQLSNTPAGALARIQVACLDRRAQP